MVILLLAGYPDMFNLFRRASFPTAENEGQNLLKNSKNASKSFNNSCERRKISSFEKILFKNIKNASKIFNNSCERRKVKRGRGELDS